METKVALLTQDMDRMSAGFDKLTCAIEKIGAVSSDIIKMLAVHDERISSQNRESRERNEVAEKHRSEITTDIQALYEKIAKSNTEISKDFYATEMKITQLLEEVKAHLLENSEKLDKRISKLESWKYTLVGVGTIFGMFLVYILPEILTHVFAKP